MKLSAHKNNQSAFTLIELVVVIAILGVLAAVLLVLINPVDKINSANDTGAVSAMAQMGRASDAFAANNSNFYERGGVSNNFAGAVSDLNSAGEVKFTTLSAPSSSYTYTYLPTPANCTIPSGATPCTAYVFYTKVLSLKYTSGNTGGNSSYYVYANGKGCFLLNQGSAPVLTTTCP